jgi:hypothetical protein
MNPRETPPESAISLRLNEPELEALEILLPKHEERRIKMDDFSDLYGDGVARDRKEVERLKSVFERENRNKSREFSDCLKRSKLFEAILAERAELDDWLGGNAQTIVVSEFDDFKNGVDLAVEFTTEGGFKHLALSVDVTTSQQTVSQKIERIKEEILGGRLTNIKYFASEESNIKGQLMRVPRVLIGTGVVTAKELATLWLKSKKSGDREEKRRSLKMLASHRVQFQILEEIQNQLDYFAKFAREKGKEDLALEYERAARVISEILGNKTLEIEISDEERAKINSDPVYKSLAEETGRKI